MESAPLEKKFSTPEEEIAYLRSEVARHKEEAMKAGVESEPQLAAHHVLRNYEEKPAAEVLAPEFKMSERKAEGIVLELAPETHDTQMTELLSVLQSHGIKNALSVVEKLNNPHIEDDFHRFLVEYLKEGYPVTGLPERTPLYKALHMTLFEISLPEPEKPDERKSLKELISSMEQFYAGLMSVVDDKEAYKNVFTFEIANPNQSTEVVYYASVPTDKKELFEKHILSSFPNVKIVEKKDDYNIFNEKGIAAASYAKSGRNPIYSLKTYDQFDHDPLNAILNAFSKIDRDGEGAAIQIVFTTVGDRYVKRYKKAIENIKKGTPVKRAIEVPDDLGGEVMKLSKDILRDIVVGEKKPKENPVIDDVAVKNIEDKISTPILSANIRIIASGADEFEAKDILSHVESAFNQFDNTRGNNLKFERPKRGHLKQLLHNYSFRMFDESQAMPISIREATSLIHFPVAPTKAAPHLREAKAGTAPVPLDLPNTGTMLGINRNRNVETRVFMMEEDRLRHFYTIGQTGTGKSTLLKNMIIQDIVQGKGVCMIDPHGVDILDVLSVIPKERYEDVIYFDPSYTERPMALNMLEYDRKYPEQKTFVVNELFSIFQKLYGAVPESMGPMFEQYFRNATMLVIEDPASGSTLLDVSRVLADKQYRALKLSRCKNPVVVQFWKEVAEKAGGEASLANIVPYITSKFDVFLANDIMRPIVAQEKSSFNFREIMDEKKILLVNLSKGRLGDINASLIGLILVGKILMAALSRVDSLHSETGMPPFYLYIDEFQNVTTNSISTILSEARKYKLSLNVAHQFIAQLEEGIRDSVFGNVGSIAAFRVGAEDAEYLEKQFAPVFTAHDLINVENHNAFVKMLVNGRPVKPFNIETQPSPKGDKRKVEALKELSYLKFGGEREDIEEQIMRKYRKEPPPPTVSPVTSPTNITNAK